MTALSEVAALEVGLAQASVLVMRGLLADAEQAGVDAGALRDLVATSEDELAALANELEPLRRAADGGDTVAALRLLQRLFVRTGQFVQAAGGAAGATHDVARSPETHQWIEALRRINEAIPAANDRLARESQIADESWTIDQAVRAGAIEPWDAFHLIPLPSTTTDPLAAVRTRAAQARTQCSGTGSAQVAAWR